MSAKITITRTIEVGTCIATPEDHNASVKKISYITGGCLSVELEITDASGEKRRAVRSVREVMEGMDDRDLKINLSAAD